MSRDRRSLLAGRNTSPLDEHEQKRVLNTLKGMDPKVSFRYDADGWTRFRVEVDEENVQFGEIVVGPDILQGRSVIDPNSALSMDAAAAHELSHYHRWRNGVELPLDKLGEIDEALTSLEAIARYDKHLGEH